MQRPFGITILSVALGCLAVVGFTNGLLEFIADRTFTSPAFAFVAFFYGITALISAIALWGMKVWAYWAFLGWVGAAVLTLLYYQLYLFRLGWLSFSGAVAVVVLLLALLERYVRMASGRLRK